MVRAGMFLFREEHVRSGMRMLDREMPGWELKINMNDLDLSDGCNCILGQLYENDYLLGLCSLGMESHEAQKFGFTMSLFPGYEELDANDRLFLWESLSKTWETLIKERLNAGITL